MSTQRDRDLSAERAFFSWLDQVAEALVVHGADYRHIGGDCDYDGIVGALWNRMCALRGLEAEPLRAETVEVAEAGRRVREARPRPQNQRRPISARTRLRIYERDGHRCVACRVNQPLTIDHIIPVSRGGTNDDTNLQTMCGPCNSRKGARTSHDLGQVRD